jgi:hypothetical protein
MAQMYPISRRCGKGCVKACDEQRRALVAKVNDEDLGGVETRYGSDDVFIPLDMGRGESVRVWAMERRCRR